MTSYALLAELVANNLTNYTLIHRTNYSYIEKPMIEIDGIKPGKIIIMFEEDDFDNYVRISVSYKFNKAGSKPVSVGVYTLCESTNVLLAMESINFKICAINNCYNNAVNVLKNSIYTTTPMTIDMLHELI